MTKVIVISLVLLALATLLFFVFLYVLYYMAFQNSKARHKRRKFTNGGQYKSYKEKIDKVHRELAEASFERVTVKNREGMMLYANYYHNRNSAPVVVMFHGYRSRAMYDNGGGYRIFTDMGYNVLIPDQRAHGDSEGNTISFGIKERFDCLDWIEYCNNRFGNDTPMLLVGVSMGAATVLMASGLDLPTNVKGVIADCPYSSPEAIIRKVITDMGLPQKLFFPFVKLSARVYGGLDITSASPKDAVKQAKVPILIIHGEADSFVPCEMSREITKGSDIQLVTVENADHGLSYIVNSELYRDKVADFINEILK